MYSKLHASKLKQEFWTAFGKYMALHLSSEGGKINWVNYKTGVRGIQFKMDADQRHATIAIVFLPTGMEDRYYEQFLPFRSLLEAHMGESWTWFQGRREGENKPGHKIEKQLGDVNIFNKEDWPSIISFLKPRILSLDAFWNEVKPAFEMLGTG